MAQDSASRKLDQYIVRFPDGMREQLKAAAKENNRSLNAEIISRLEESFVDLSSVPINLSQEKKEIRKLILDFDKVVSHMTQAINDVFENKDNLKNMVKNAYDKACQDAEGRYEAERSKHDVNSTMVRVTDFIAGRKEKPSPKDNETASKPKRKPREKL